MKTVKIIFVISTFFFSSLLIPQEYVFAKDITVCSFNIQFLGMSTKRDNSALTELVKSYDIVVVQELVAPPYIGKFPNGDPFKPDKEASEFFDLMTENNFKYILSEEDTGKGKKNHSNGSATEWWVVFYKSTEVDYASDLPHGFLAKDVTANPKFDRVPYAFPFRTKSGKLDFVLISVHLRPGDGAKNRDRRYDELHSIYSWIDKKNSEEKDFIVLGDMNIESQAELQALEIPHYVSLNSECVRTNTLINSDFGNGAKPYDHVLYNVTSTKSDIDMLFGFKVVDLVKAMKPKWTGSGAYPGDPYKHDIFRQYYSDHHPVVFKMSEKNLDDD